MAMASTGDIAAVRTVLNDLYTDGDDHPVSRGRIVEEMELLDIQDDLMNYFAKLRPGDYTRDQLTETIDSMIQNDGRADEVGLIH